MNEIWVQCDEFPEYFISSFGRISRITVDDRKKIIKPSLTKQGALKLNLWREGKAFTRSVKVLVADAFVVGKTEIFNTPIHLDGDQLNVYASNLAWRPRWFAWKYTRQFELIEIHNKIGPVMDLNSRIIFPSVADAAIANGLLFKDVRFSMMNDLPIFPFWKIFGLVEE